MVNWFSRDFEYFRPPPQATYNRHLRSAIHMSGPLETTDAKQIRNMFMSYNRLNIISIYT